MKKEKLNIAISKLKIGQYRLHSIPKVYPQDEQVEIRRRYLSEITGVNLDILKLSSEESMKAATAIENCIGAVRIPIGIAGPMKLIGSQGSREIFIPLATTEGALVASVNRGISICNRQGGIKTELYADGMTRAPLFQGEDARHIKKSIKWINNHLKQLDDCCRSTSRYCRLIDIQLFPMGHLLNARFAFSTGEAMGMNMATFAAQKCAEYISAKTKLELISIAGNLCSDKKAAAINAILGRGKTVCAWINLPVSIIEEKLRTSAARLQEIALKKVLLGSAFAQSLSYNAHAANIIAAIFVATGQDIPQIVESSNAFVWIEPKNDSILLTVQLQSLEVGTIGGGTSQPGPAALLDLMGCRGLGSARLLAEAICGAVLAGELSYLGALASGEAILAHQMLGRRV